MLDIGGCSSNLYIRSISSISTFELTQNHGAQLHEYRSRRLLGVGCSDWYQNEAEEVYFLFFSNPFCVGVFFRFQKLEKHDTHRPKEVLFRNLIHFGFTENVVKMLDRMLKIQNFTIRQLPSSKPFPTCVLSKYEQFRSYLECARPIPDDPPSETRY